MTCFGRATARARHLLALLSLLLPAAWAVPVEAQSLTSGAMRGQVVSNDGSPVISAQITVTNQSAGTGYSFFTDRRGRFSLSLVIPGTYAVLAEQAGYQPVRQHGIVVRPGDVTQVNFVLERRPPPVTTIVEIPETGASTLATGRWIGEDVDGAALQNQDLHQPVTDLSRDASQVEDPRDGRSGFALAAGGLPQLYSRFFVDAIEETFLRHGGLLSEPASTPLFPRNGLLSALVLDNAFDSEWDGAPGALLSAESRVGSRGLMLRPYLTYSNATLGGKSEDNPADSSAMSLQAGAVLTGSLVKDTAQFVLGFNYETLETPSANPWERDSTAFGGTTTSLRDTLPIVAADSFGTAVDGFVTPVIRTFRGGNGFGRIDWRLSGSTSVFARMNFAKWKEQRPQLGVDLPSGAATQLDGRDLSGAIGVTLSGNSFANEFRMGIRLAKRDWTSGLAPATYLVAEGAAIGYSPLLPALFDQRSIDVNDVIQLSSGNHRIKFGLGLSFGKWEQDYAYGRNGIYRFGDLDALGNAQGDFFQIVAPGSVDISTKDIELFLQDVWALAPSFQLQGGIRLDRQSLPNNEIKLNQAWLSTSGITYDIKPQGGTQFSPRIGFVWQNRASWVVRGGGGLYAGRTNPALFSEAVLFDGSAVARRAQGTFSSWPAVPDSVVAPVIGPRLTLFDDEYRNSRTSKWDLSISHALGGRISLEVAGTYHHTDFIPRRQDLNLIGAASGQTQEGRPIYGTLVKQGGMLSPLPGSNHRFGTFELVSGIVANGFSDYYGVTATVERRSQAGIGLRASYTFSKTEDNYLLGPSGDPTDQLSPFPEDAISDEWVDGRSDLDIPHRLVVSADYTFPGRTALDVSLRYRFRSGLPFTPGFRPGVDINGDGSGGNDPAFIDNSVAGTDQLLSDHDCLASQVGEFAARNSCREKAAHSLDVRLALRLPVQVMGGALQLTVDAFNVVSTETGFVDRAVYLVDPTQPLTTGSNGAVVVPLIANPQFGTLLSRRGQPRLVRFGLKVDY
jgi:hypothetical protein